MHGAFTATAVRCFPKAKPDEKKRPPFALGVVFAMLLHAIGNAPIIIAALYLDDIPGPIKSQLLFFWVLAYAIVMVSVVARYLGFGVLKHMVLGKARCPTCKAVYQRDWFAANMLWKRYEQCGACGTWQWIDERRDTVSDEEEPKQA